MCFDITLLLQSNMTQRSLFSMNRTKYFSKPQAFAKVTYHGIFKCEGKCYPNTQPELCWKMLLFIIFYINFMFILISSFQVFILIFLYVFIILYCLLFYFNQQMLLLFILLVLDWFCSWRKETFVSY